MSWEAANHVFRRPMPPSLPAEFNGAILYPLSFNFRAVDGIYPDLLGRRKAVVVGIQITIARLPAAPSRRFSGIGSYGGL